MLCTLIRGQMSHTFFQLGGGGTCPPMSIAWGQMSLYAIFHRGAHVGGRGGEGEMSYTRFAQMTREGNSIELKWLRFFTS